MKQYPDKKHLRRPICRKCVNQVFYEGIPFCKKIAPYFNDLGACKDFQERKSEEINEQIDFFSKIP